MSLLRNFATVGAATASSRILGFVRDMLIAAALGTGAIADAYFVAQRLPNLFRRLFAEGAFQSAFVPIYARTLEEGGADEARRFGEEALAGLAASLLVVTVLAEIGMVWLTYALAPGFADDPGKFDLAVLLGRIAFPYLALVSVVSLLSGVLNSVGRFAAAAFSPSLLNVVLIAALVFIYFTGQIETMFAGVALTAAITVGGVLQLAVLAFACRRAGIGLALRRPRWTPGLRRLVALAGPSVLAGGVVQINIVVGTIIASALPGAVSWLYYADRLYQLPLGIVGIAIGVVLLPDLARALRAGRPGEARHTQNRAIEFATALTLPAAVALAVIPVPIIALLFERGAFSAADTAATAPALAAYAVGLPAFVAIKVLQPAFFAREDTRTPMWFGVISMVVNVVAAFALFGPFGPVGIAAATSLAAWINAAMLAAVLLRRGDLVVDAAMKRRLPLLALAAAIMGAALYAADRTFGPGAAAAGLAAETLFVGGLVIGGMAVFMLFAQVTGVVDFRRVFALRRR